MSKLIYMLMLILVLSCNKIKIKDEFEFYYYDTYGYCNIYFYEVPVIAGGCDSAKWDDEIIVVKSNKWRCKSEQECYYIINMALYAKDIRQELSSGVKGPLSQEEFLKVDPLKSSKFIGAN